MFENSSHQMATKPVRMKLQTLKPRLKTLEPRIGTTSKPRYSETSGWSRESRHKRGYGTAWQKLRLEILQRDNYLCQCPQCKQEKRITPANAVDHIIPKARFAAGEATGDPDDPSNLRAINKRCHIRVTLEQRGFRGRTEIGADGYPIVKG